MKNSNTSYKKNFKIALEYHSKNKFHEAESIYRKILKKDYVRIAIKLAKNINFRLLVINKIKNNSKKLFNNKDVVKNFENFLQKVKL